MEGAVVNCDSSYPSQKEEPRSMQSFQIKKHEPWYTQNGQIAA